MKNELAVCIALLCGVSFCFGGTTGYYLYVGTYTDDGSRGLYVAEFDSKGPSLSELRLAAGFPGTTYQSISSDGKILCSTGIIEGLGENNGALKSYSIQANGDLKELSARPTLKSPLLAHVNYQSRLGYLFAASYWDGKLYTYPVDDYGKIGEEAGYAEHVGGSNVVKERQSVAHPHSVFVHPGKPFIYVPDLGQDAIVQYRFHQRNGAIVELSRMSTAPGSGPRHMAFHSSGRFAYVNNEITSTVNTLKVDRRKGSLSIIETLSTVPDSYEGPNATAQILLSPDEKRLYVSNRGHDSIAIFEVDETTGKLTAKGNYPSKGKSPRNFAFDPTGRWMAVINRNGNNLIIYEVDTESGLLKDTGLEVAVSTPSCVNWVKAP